MGNTYLLVTMEYVFQCGTDSECPYNQALPPEDQFSDHDSDDDDHEEIQQRTNIPRNETWPPGRRATKGKHKNATGEKPASSLRGIKEQLQ